MGASKHRLKVDLHVWFLGELKCLRHYCVLYEFDKLRVAAIAALHLPDSVRLSVPAPKKMARLHEKDIREFIRVLRGAAEKFRHKGIPSDVEFEVVSVIRDYEVPEELTKVVESLLEGRTAGVDRRRLDELRKYLTKPIERLDLENKRLVRIL